MTLTLEWYHISRRRRLIRSINYEFFIQRVVVFNQHTLPSLLIVS